MIKIYLHVFLPNSQRSYNRIHKNRILSSNLYGTLTHLLGSKRIYKDHTIVFTNIIFVTRCLWKPDSSVKIQYYLQILYSSSNIYAPWLICHDPMQILFESYPDLSTRIKLIYCLAYWFNIISKNRWAWKAVLQILEQGEYYFFFSV